MDTRTGKIFTPDEHEEIIEMFDKMQKEQIASFTEVQEMLLAEAY